jgi:hypothetical protein
MKGALHGEGGRHRFIVDSVGKDLYYKTLKMKKTRLREMASDRAEKEPGRKGKFLTKLAFRSGYTRVAGEPVVRETTQYTGVDGRLSKRKPSEVKSAEITASSRRRNRAGECGPMLGSNIA